jgi:hypothetical protein
MNKLIIKFRILFTALLVFLPNFVFASQINFEIENNQINIGDTAKLNIYLDTKTDSINAVEGKIILSSLNYIKINNINDGNSAINFWINKPKVIGNSIEYSGLTPAGIIGSKRLLFSIEVTGLSTGDTSIKSETITLKNDGYGTKAKTDEGYLLIKTVPSNINGNDLNKLEQNTDNDPPESFIPIIGNDPNIFEGKSFIAFATQDKASGIDHYEIKEGIFGSYEVAESPYLIKDQSLNKTFYVKAIDNKDNQIVQKIGGNNKNFYQVIIIAIMILLVIFKFRKKRHAH